MKRIPHTSEITARLRTAFGDEVKTEKFAVFEAIALNQRPIRQRHPLFEGAIAQDSLLRELVTSIETESAPLQIMHRSGELPNGRVFSAKLVEGGEVRVLFAIPLDRTQLVEDIDNGVIDQVSVNVMAKRLECSECGWDYLGEDCNFMHYFEGVCDNGHKLREGGVHLKMHGLDALAEISLVNSGGADGARIVPSNKSAFTNNEAFQRLAASGHFAPAMTLATLQISQSEEGKPNMDAQLVNDLTTAKAEALTLKSQIETKDAALAAANTALEAANTTVASLQAELTAANEKVAALEAATDHVPEGVATFIKETCTATAIALGKKPEDVPSDIVAQVELIKEGRTTLTNLIPVGGAALKQVDDIEPKKAAPRGNSAFMTRR